jgi:hypothetical protein
MARVYAGWGFSQAFYREKLDLKMGFASLEDFLIGFWEGLFLPRDANNLLAMLGLGRRATSAPMSSTMATSRGRSVRSRGEPS